MRSLMMRHGRWAGALLLIAAVAACPREEPVVADDPGVIGAEYEDANVVADLNGHIAASIEAAQIARERATNPEVRQFAQRMETAHGQQQQQLANIMRQHGLVGVEPDRTGAIGDHTDDVRDLREREAGGDFDRAYMDQAVDYHQTMINRVEDAIDRTERADFRQSLEQLRLEFEQQLREAEQLRERLND